MKAPEPHDVIEWAREHLGALARDSWDPAPFPGGFAAAQRALSEFDVRHYARTRNDVWPPDKRGASRLSPYIRHGLLQLPDLWQSIDGPPEDVTKFRDELLWQEYARHVYARLGRSTAHSLRFVVPERMSQQGEDEPWESEARCIRESWGELTSGGWITNQQRMWLASQWSVREERGWRDGEDLFFRHLLDGSRAANRVGWQWTSGALTGKPYGFSRWQVMKRAPDMCAQCSLAERCPIEDWPPESERDKRTVVDPRIRYDPDLENTRGPRESHRREEPEWVWLTAESLGDRDPALRAHPELPVVFVFDAPLLTRVRVSAKRLIFLTQALADLGTRREVHVHVGDPSEVLVGHALAVTFAPVPGFRQRSAALTPAVIHPWPWLIQPHAGPVTSFTAWWRASEGYRGGRR